ncbi:MAG TPA: hypothetical protein VEL28_00150 [Candidatus Binatia bacterium]|nr:hypothetical protein [Candidatus Binatia bacterium]
MSKGIVPAFVAAALLTAAPAQALDVQGTWTGRQVCKVFNGGKFVDKFESVMEIVQTGNEVAIDVDGGEYVYFGTVIESQTVPTKGEIGLTDCDPDSDEVGRLKISGNKAKGISIYRTDEENDTCKWKYARASTAAPAITACPDSVTTTTIAPTTTTMTVP